MNLKYGKFDILEQELEKLPPLNRVAFAVACCERLYPHLDILMREVRNEGWNEENFFRIALDEIWQFLAIGKIDTVRVAQLISSCEDNYPHDGNYEYSAESQRAASAIDSILMLCSESNPTPQRTISVVRQASETLFEYIDYLSEYEYDDWEDKSHQETLEIIAKHPFTVRELAKQTKDLHLLQENHTLTPEFLQWLRNSSENGGKSLVDLSWETHGSKSLLDPNLQKNHE